jgi:Domain of unknown function (DUF4872)/Butirosin biosynthesis protein H, N-terminal
MAFEHRHAAHCESGVMSALLRHHGAPISEAAAFGLSGALTFAYLPFVKVNGFPLIAFRMPPKAIIKGLRRPLGARMRFETFRNEAAGAQRLDALLGAGQLVGAQTSVYWLPYFPPEMRFHFNAHNLLIYGKEGDDYLISDPVAEDPVRCAAPDLARARFARGLLAPKGLIYTLEALERPEPPTAVWRAAIRRTARQMLAPVPIVGVRGIRMLARAVARLDPGSEHSKAWVGHIVRMQEEIGTGGAGFRFLYAAFLQEAAERAECPALNAEADTLLAIGDTWREFALRAARMIRGREAFVPGTLAAQLQDIAQREAQFFGTLRRVVR